MKFLIYTLALISAFFVSNAYSVDYIDSDYVPAESQLEIKHYCYLNGVFVGLMGKEACKALGLSEKPDYYGWKEYDKGHGKTSWEGFCDCGYNGRTINYVTYHYFKSEQVISDDLACPSDSNPLHKIGPVHKPNEDTTQPPRWCLPNTPNRCPTPTGNDPFVFGTSVQTNVCFDNPDGTQCKIETGDDGSYYMPISYGSQEPVRCNEIPNKPVDKTPAPEEKPAPEETDPEPEIADLDALNKINENLDSMNTNQVNSSDSNDERLDRVAAEIQISNDLLGAIRDKPSGSGATNVTVDTAVLETKQDESNDLQKEILQELKKQNETVIESTFDPSQGQSFYQSVYENGFEGVWEEKSQLINQTGFFQFLEQFKMSFGGGSAPNMQICFNVMVDLGCKSIPFDWAFILPFLKLCILLTAAFTCRKIIFGG